MTRPFESTAMEGIVVVDPNVCVERVDMFGKASGSLFSAILLVVAASKVYLRSIGCPDMKSLYMTITKSKYGKVR